MDTPKNRTSDFGAFEAELEADCFRHGLNAHDPEELRIYLRAKIMELGSKEALACLLLAPVLGSGTGPASRASGRGSGLGAGAKRTH